MQGCINFAGEISCIIGNKQSAGIIGANFVYKLCTKDRDSLIEQSDMIKYQQCIINCYGKS